MLSATKPVTAPLNWHKRDPESEARLARLYLTQVRHVLLENIAKGDTEVRLALGGASKVAVAGWEKAVWIYVVNLHARWIAASVEDRLRMVARISGLPVEEVSKAMCEIDAEGDSTDEIPAGDDGVQAEVRP